MVVGSEKGRTQSISTHTHTGLSQPFRPRSLSFLASRPRAPDVHVSMSGQGEQACEVVIGQGQLPRSTCQRAAWCRHIIGNPNRKGLRSLRVKKPTKPAKTTARCLPFFVVFHEGSRPVIIWIIRYTPSIWVKEVIDTVSKNNFDHYFFCYKKFTKYS